MDSGATREENKPHALCIPLPAQGHINAMLQLAKLLHSRNIRITFVHTLSNYNRILDTAGPSSLDGLPDFRFETINDGDDQLSNPLTGEQLSSFCLMVRNKLPGSFRQLLKRLALDGFGGGPKVTCIVSDTFSSYTLDVAAEFGIPDVSFCSVSACGFWGVFRYKELVETGIVPLKRESDLINGYLHTLVNWIPGKSMRLRDFPSCLRTTDPDDIVLNFCKDESQAASKATAIIINTLDDLEGPVLDAMAGLLPPIYAVGPLNLMCHQIHDESVKTIGSSLWKEDDTCFKWLEGRARGSVIYVNFGSLAVLTSGQLTEFAWGLANSGHVFLWIIRPNTVTSDAAILPEEFCWEVRDRGLIISWCRQEEVLKHPSVGGFLTHCGWNSMSESISWGVPMICWPCLGDQQTNCRYACDDWGIGMEMSDDVRREDVEEIIRELLGGEKGVEMRRVAQEWKERAGKATQPDGKSFLNLERVIKEVIHPKKRMNVIFLVY